MRLANKILIVFFTTVVLAWCGVALLKSDVESTDVASSALIQSALAEVEESFTYKGVPIHPDLVKEFEVWLSDNCSPVTVSVDIIAAVKARNEYDSDAIVVDEGRVRANSSDGTGYYEYERLGTLKNGIHVLKASDYGGGSGLFQKLLFVKFVVDEAYDMNGKKCKRLIMTVVRGFTLGDRDNSSIELGENRVIVSPSRYRPEQTILSF